MKKKKVVKKKAKKVVKSQEVVIRVIQPDTIPSTQDLAEPMRDGKKLTIGKTWVGEAQLIKILQGTPKQYVYKRPGKGGGTFDYVTTAYMQKALNYIFGWDWDFDVIEHGIEGNQVWVKGKLTVRGEKPGQQIVKTQFGRADIKYKKGTKEMLDFGNDLKAATSDALKKCASMLGIASDIYGKAEYKMETNREPVEVVPNPVTHPKEQTEPTIAPDAEHSCVGPDGKGCRYGVPDISAEVASYSMKMFGKEMCRDCQKDAKQK